MLKMSEKDYPVSYRGPKADLYAWYYNTQACLMYGGAAWNKWNRMFQDEITQNQNPDGSWPPIGNPKNPGGKLQVDDYDPGPIYRTTLCILMLEVYYRYIPTVR